MLLTIERRWENRQPSLFSLSYLQRAFLTLKFQILIPHQFRNLRRSHRTTGAIPERDDTLPHFQVPLLELSIVNRQDVEVLLESKRVEGQLYPAALARDDDPRAVGVVWVPVWEPRALDGAVGTLDQASAALI